MAKEDLLTLEGQIGEILPDGRFGVVLENNHRIIADTSGKMRKLRIRSVVADRVRIEIPPNDLQKGRIVFREKAPTLVREAPAARIAKAIAEEPLHVP